MFVLFGLMLLLPAALTFQIGRIQFAEGEALNKLSLEQATTQIPIKAQRGNIYDAKGRLLTTNSVSYVLAFDPKAPNVKPQTFRSLADSLSKITKNPVQFYVNKKNAAPSNSRYIVLERQLSIPQKNELELMGFPGIILEEKFQRRYAFGSLAAHVIGFVNHEFDGKIGVEASYDAFLRGKDGLQQVRKDPKNRTFNYLGAPKKLPTQGNSVIMTIDAHIQAILEEELRSGVLKHNAKYGTAVIVDPKTGAIKAMANYPTFDPNSVGSDVDENRKNYMIADRLEPGSTFKLVTAIAAYEQKKVRFGEIFETGEKGEREIHGLMIRDHEPYGNLTFEQVIQKSSNVATAEIAQRLNANVFYQYARNMGFGSLTYIDLVGETEGILTKPFQWSKVSQPWIAHGYEVLATPLQVAMAYSGFANGGKMMKPYIVDRVLDENGDVVYKNEPVVTREIARKKTIQDLLPVFEGVVSDSGTADLVQLEGVRIAGKTGTAKKVVNGKYQNIYRASFVGFFPVEDPKYVVFILIDEPKTFVYGGLAAGPVFKNVANRLAALDHTIYKSEGLEGSEKEVLAQAPNLINLPKNKASEILQTLKLPFSFEGKGAFVTAQSVAEGTSFDPKKEILKLKLFPVPLGSELEAKEGFVSMPELRGMNMREAIFILASLRLESENVGSGTIYSQFPKAGEWVRHGTTVNLRGKSKSMELISTVK